MLVQPSQIAAYALEGVAVYEPRAASAARTASTRASPDRLSASAPTSWASAIRTYTSNPGGPYRTRSHQSTSERSNHCAASGSAADRISVTLISVVQRTRQANCIFMPRSAVGCRRSPGRGMVAHHPAQDSVRARYLKPTDIVDRWVSD